MKIPHVFYSSLPSAKGRDIRNRDVVESQAEVGLDVFSVSSPFQPPGEPGTSVEQYGGITYHRSVDVGDGLSISEQDQGLKVKLRKALQMFSFGDFMADLARREKPDVIHAHSVRSKLRE